MLNRVAWDKYEIALLIESCERVFSGASQKQEINKISKLLRNRAIANGLEIDDLFRNENGIALQMNKMEYLLSAGTKGLPGAGKNFKEIVLLKQTSPSEYEKILKTAKKQIEYTNNGFKLKMSKRESFIKWIKAKGKLNVHTSRVVSVLDECSEYAKKHGVSNISIWEIDDAVKFIAFYRKLSNNKFFRIIKKDTAKLFDKTYVYYKEFLTENNLEQEECLSNNLNSKKIHDTLEIKVSAEETHTEDNVPEGSIHYIQNTSDTSLENKNSQLHNKLYAISKVYDEPQGITIDRIVNLIGEQFDKESVINFLNEVSWATKLGNELYTFSANPVLIAEIEKEAEKVDDDVISDSDKEKYIEVLKSRYRGGMQFDSIDLDIFRDTYSDLYDEELKLPDDLLIEQLKCCGVEYRDRLFPAEAIMDDTAHSKLFQYIENKFNTAQMLYYKSIYSDLSDVFRYCFSLADEQMLKEYIKFSDKEHKYFYHESFMSVVENIIIDHSKEIDDYMLSAGKPLSYDEIYTGLSHVSKEIIYKEIRSGSQYIMNEKEHYFHIDIFEFSPEDKDIIVDIINKEIDEKEYAIWAHVFSLIQDKMPVFLENNLYLSSLGIRNTLSIKLKDIFNFDGEVISKGTEKLSMSDVFRLYAKHNDSFTNEDIYNFSKEVGTVIYFWALSEESVRVSKELFVSKNRVQFDSDAVDKALESYLTTGYILLKEIDSFLLFPYVGYEWNEYLLESYLMHYSKKYCLVNNGVSLNNVAGAIATIDSEYTQFFDICADVIANSNVELKKAQVLDYLAEVGLITRRSYSNIDAAITKAKQIRNQKR